jgi:hypothetical protein
MVDLIPRATERALEDRIGYFAGLQRYGRQVLAEHVIRGATGQCLLEPELVPETLRHRVQHATRFAGYLRPDEVPRQDGDVEDAHGSDLSAVG